MSPESISTSPSKPAPAQSKLDHLNELAANARRERKVLDLEISNSSLLAINRTLEAEMRKQKGELRHLRRLRSSGRFPSSTRSASSRFSMPSAGDDLSPTSSADEDGLDDDRFSNLSSGTSDDTSFPDSLSFSPTLRNSALPVAKGRRSRCFKLDLSAQRSLLLDSQKLNQALKRCLGRTDELIADGKKALEYKVNTGDVANLGPRVLTPEERDEELELGRGLLSPGFEGKAENPWERIRSSQPGKLEGLMLHIPAGRNRDNVDDQKQVHGPSIGQEVLGPKAQESADRVQQDPDINTVPEPRTIEAPVTDAASTDEPTTPGKLNIPYEDPGIDTGSDTQPLDNNVGEIGAHREDSSSESTAPEEEPRISSPGKGLGDFLRIVGGSWGV